VHIDGYDSLTLPVASFINGLMYMGMANGVAPLGVDEMLVFMVFLPSVCFACPVVECKRSLQCTSGSGTFCRVKCIYSVACMAVFVLWFAEFYASFSVRVPSRMRVMAESRAVCVGSTAACVACGDSVEAGENGRKLRCGHICHEHCCFNVGATCSHCSATVGWMLSAAEKRD